MKDEYKGYTIKLDERNEFSVTGPGLDKPRCFESYGKAKNGIDDLIVLLVKKKRADADLNLAALTPDGVRRAITGIHPRQHVLNGVGDVFHVFPDVPALVPLLEEAGRLRKRVKEIEQLVKRCEIPRNRGYFSIHQAAAYEEAVAALKSEYASAAKAAGKLAAKG